MKKILSFLFILIFIVSAVSACKNEPEPEVTEPDTPEPISKIIDIYAGAKAEILVDDLAGLLTHDEGSSRAGGLIFLDGDFLYYVNKPTQMDSLYH